MKTNRMFYIGLGCVFSTLFWTITAFVAQENQSSEQKKKTFRVEHLICSEFSLVNENDEEVMVMLNQHPADPNKGPTFVIQDMRHRKDGTESLGHLSLYRNGLTLYNSRNASIVGLTNVRDGGLLWAKNAKREATWIVDANARKPIPPPPPKED